MRKAALRAATALMPVAAITMTSPVQAQTDPETDIVDSSNEVLDSSNDIAGYGEIVVTAQGREQLVQDVPIAISVVDAATIENAGIEDIRGLRQLSPSLQATTGQSAATGTVLYIRGVGTAGDNPGFEPAVGVFIDGVFRARAGLALANLPELDRVEVLRGPQGTLFGRNTSAGALNIITAGPEFTLGGHADISYGNYDAIEFNGGVTGPVSESIALRFDGGYKERDGYIKEVNTGKDLNNEEEFYLRGQGLFDNGDNIQFRLIGDYAESDERCCAGATTVIDPGFGAVINGIAAGSGLVGVINPNDPENRDTAFTPGRLPRTKVDEWGVSGQLDIQLGDISLTSITAYRDFDAMRDQDVDNSGLDRAYREDYKTGLKDFTQEIRLQGSAFEDKLDWLVGAFYLNEELTLTDTVRTGTDFALYTDTILANAAGRQVFGNAGPTPFLFGGPLTAPAAGDGLQGDNYTVDTEAFGLFTHNIFEITDRLTFTGGLRYNHEKKDLSADLNSVFTACDQLQSLANVPVVGLKDTQTALAAAAAGGSAAAAAQLAGLQSGILLTCNPTLNTEFNGDYDGGRSEDAITGTARLAFKVNDDVLLFGGYSRGYKSGGYNLDRGSFDSTYLLQADGTFGNGAQVSDLEFGKETVNSFEIGIKTNPTPFMQFNLTGFYQDFDGYQNLRFEGTRFVVRQYDQLISSGIEAELGLRPADDVTMQLGYTYLHSEVDDPVTAGDNDGRRIVNNPAHVFTGAVTWTPALNENTRGLLHLDWRGQSRANTYNLPSTLSDIENRIDNGPYAIFNARIGVTFDERYSLEVYGENIFNQYFNRTSFPVPEQTRSDGTGNYAIYPGEPRYYGIRAKARF